MVRTYEFHPTTLLTSTLSPTSIPTTPPQTRQFSSASSTSLACTSTCLIALPTILLSLAFLLTAALLLYHYRQKALRKRHPPPSILPGNYRYAANASANSSATTLSVPQPAMVGHLDPTPEGSATGEESVRNSARESVNSAFIYDKHTSYSGPAGLALAPPPEPESTVRKILSRPLSLFSVISRRETEEEHPPPLPEYRSADGDLGTGVHRGRMAERREVEGEWVSPGHGGEEVRVSQIGVGR